MEMRGPISSVEMQHQGSTSIAWFNERISQQFTMTKDSKINKGKESITPPVPK
jgi:hypothetical protein